MCSHGYSNGESIFFAIYTFKLKYLRPLLTNICKLECNTRFGQVLYISYFYFVTQGITTNIGKIYILKKKKNMFGEKFNLFRYQMLRASIHSGCVFEPVDKELFNLGLDRHKYLSCFTMYPARWHQTRKKNCTLYYKFLFPFLLLFFCCLSKGYLKASTISLLDKNIP